MKLLTTLIGAVLARSISNIWLRRIFMATVIALAVKTIVYDVPWGALHG